ncbi:MAG TPA: M6 family metalloprotease domain-containing protein [Pyrinomonadaceae bacterium]|nr:M6 family metalloprotease domain-containing protein [Pyrinomonadaceae bacterium]
MSGIFNEQLTFKQENGPDVRLVVMGDEHYAHYETIDGYTVVYDVEKGLYCYAITVNGRFVSTGVPMNAAPPPEIRRHITESEEVRQLKFTLRHANRQPPPPVFTSIDTVRTLGPNNGLLTGRRVSTGTVRGLTVLVEFQDVTTTITQQDVEEMLNGANFTRNGNFCSAREYFRIVSNGRLDYTNTVVGPVKLSRNQQFYVNNSLVPEAMQLAVNTGIDLSQFDSRNEGVIDAVNFLYAGQSRYEEELWPHNSFLELRFGNFRTNFYLLTGLGSTPNDLTIGTFCHENGHLLCRFPDMYDYGNRDGDGVKSAGIGSYCLMGAGNHLNFGRTPAPVCAYLRDLAGWCDNVVDLTQPGTKEARHADYRTLMKYPTDKFNEYFLIENRSKLGLDQHLPASGLAVYHCDTNGSNEFQEGSSTRHYQCALLQADGRTDLERNANRGDGGDLYGAIAGTALSHATAPSSRQWDNIDSRLVLSQISAPGEVITFQIGEATTGGQVVVGEASPQLDIPDNISTSISSSIALNQAGFARRIKVGVSISHTYVGDLEVELVSPSGDRAVIHNRQGGNQDNLRQIYDSAANPALAALTGKAAAGNWELRVRDLEAQDTGKLDRWNIEIEVDGTGNQVERHEVAPNLEILDNNPVGVSSSLAFSNQGTARQVKLAVDIEHTFIGDLRVELFSPSGRQALLHAQTGGGADNLTLALDSNTPASPLLPLVGQPVQGNWVLRVTDVVGQDVGRLKKWSLELTPQI